MGAQKKTIPINDLRPGMFVGDVFNDKNVLLFSSNTFITGYHQIEYLRKQGVTSVTIINKPHETETVSSSGDDTGLSGSIEQYVAFKKQAKQAEAVRKKTVDAVRSMIFAAKAGRFFSLNTITQSLQDLVNQVIEHPDVTIGVTQIKNYSEQVYAHSVNVSVLMIGLASVMGYSRGLIVEAGIAGMLHDIGMVRLPDELIRREGIHTRQEMEAIKKHPSYGIEIVKKFSNELPGSVFRVIAEHHERLNGSGYPRFLKGDQIHQISMFCAIADVYDRLTTQGGAKKACSPQEALALIFQGAEEEYPRNLVEYFTKLMGIYPVGSFVKLESGEMGLVIKINRDHLLAPQLVILFDSGGKRVEKLHIRDLSRYKESERNSWKISCSMDPAAFGINPADIFYSHAEIR